MSLLLAAPAISAAVSAAAYKHLWLDSKTLPFVQKSCSNAASLFSSGPQSTLKELVCIRTTYLTGLFADRSGIGALMVFASILIPLFVRLGYNAASPNNRSPLQGAILPSLVILMGSIDTLVVGSGAALLIPTLVSTMYVLGAGSRKRSADLSRLPCPAPAIYGVNIASAVLAFFMITSMVYDPKSTATGFWWEGYAPAQLVSTLKPARDVLADIFPAFLLPILVLGYRSVNRVKDDKAAKSQLSALQAEEVAYGFERTWAYYRQTGLLSFMSYIWGMSMVYRGVVNDGKTPSTQAQHLFALSFLLVLTHFIVALSDAYTTPEHNDAEALKAINRAPAGNPGVEDNLKVLAPLALVSGPSLAAMLWAAKVEEIRGYKARRTWRALSAKES